MYGQRGQRDQSTPANGQITGYVLEQKSKEPLEFANITIYSAKDSSIVTGSITDAKGYFKITGVRYGKFFLKVSFIGYGELTVPDITITSSKPTVNLDKIYVGMDAQILSEVTIETQINEVEYKLDKKVVNVNSVIASEGASAVEVLENVPSITTTIDGDVLLRGSESFLVLIDGRPSPLSGSEALQQIPASSIDKIEIITNPSAKYEAEGAGGIINVILRKDRRAGYNGQVSLNYGSFNSFGGSALFNFRANKFNFFIGGDYNMRKSEGSSISKRETYMKDTTYYLNNNANNNANFNSGSARLGFDYFLTDKDIFTVSGKFGVRNRNQERSSLANSWYQNNKTNDIFREYNYLTGNTSFSHNSYYSGDINYTRKFTKEGHELQAYFNYSDNSGDDESEYSEQETDFYGNYINNITKNYRTVNDRGGQTTTVKIDYVLPLTETGKLEMGWQMKFSDTDNDYKYQTKEGNYWTDDTTKLNPYTFSNKIQSGYAIYSNFYKKLGYQVGLRTEYTDRLFHQINTGNEWTHNQFDFFPTLHVSYKLPADMQVLASYSRRFQRPRDQFLDPFEEVIDPNNVRKGNPNLLPQYTNNYDMSCQKSFDNNKHFISVEAYLNQTYDKIERITVLDENNPNINVATFDNVGKDISAGTEIMANLNLNKWWNLNVSGNVFYYEIISNKYNNNHTVTWRTRMNNTFRIKSSNTAIQFGGNYMGPSITSQGKSYGSFTANLGVRQDFFDKRLSASLNLRDIFRTGKWRNETSTDLFYSYSEFIRKSPTFSVSLTYKLNDFKIRKEKNTDSDYGDDDI